MLKKIFYVLWKFDRILDLNMAKHEVVLCLTVSVCIYPNINFWPGDGS